MVQGQSERVAHIQTGSGRLRRAEQMNLIFKSLIWLIEFTIAVGLAGGLVDMTRTMGKEAIKAHTTARASAVNKYLLTP